jgi:hypothetical protein
MGLDFLLNYGGRRLRQYADQPLLEPSEANDTEEEKRPKVELDFEKAPHKWEALTVASNSVDSQATPRRFIDGCHYGTMVIRLQISVGHVIPVRLAEIGGVCMRINGRTLRREFAHIDRIVCSIVDPFPWHEVEDFATALAHIQLRLVPVKPPKDETTGRISYDFAAMGQATYTEAQAQMRILEELALDQDPDVLSLVDGPLMRIDSSQAIGVIKQHREPYLGLQPRCWQVFYDLKPGERTPAFKLSSQRPLVSWYLKLDGENGSMPNWGVVRVEISAEHFEREGRDFDYLNRVSNALLHLRCRQGSYARAPVSMEPIVRAEESLKSLFTPPATLAQRFYHQTGL